jgi:hypothetical protein
MRLSQLGRSQNVLQSISYMPMIKGRVQMRWQNSMHLRVRDESVLAVDWLRKANVQGS